MGKKYDKEISKTYQIFEAANKILGLSHMSNHWKKSQRQIYSWSADPDHCEVHSENPLEKMKIMLMELKKNDNEHIVKEALSLLTEPLGYTISNLKSYDPSSRKSISIIFQSIVLNIAELLKFYAEYPNPEKIEGMKKHKIEVIIETLLTDLNDLIFLLDVEKLENKKSG